MKKQNLKSKNTNHKKTAGITLIALVVTIIVLLILAGISIMMLSGNNGILQRAAEAKIETEKSQIIENAQVDVLGQQTENNGNNITKKQLTTILNKYFKNVKEADIPDEISSSSDAELTTKDEKYKINLSQIYSGSFEIEQAKWTYNHDTQTVTNGTLTLNIGDYINDTETNVEDFDGKWRVLGEENGQLLLVTATCWAPFEGASTKYGEQFPGLLLSGAEGYNTGVTKLKAVGETYANSSIKFESGRCITIEDVNKITGYNPNNVGKDDPNKVGTGKVFDGGNGFGFAYGTEVIYKMINEKVNYSTDGGKTYIARTEKTFKPITDSENNLSGDSICRVTSDCYYYNGVTLTANSSESNPEGLNTSSPAYNMLFAYSGPPYWLASPCVDAGAGSVTWGYRFVRTDGISIGSIFSSFYGNYDSPYGVRPVISLKSNIVPTFVSKDDTTKISTYEI